MSGYVFGVLWHQKVFGILDRYKYSCPVELRTFGIEFKCTFLSRLTFLVFKFRPPYYLIKCPTSLDSDSENGDTLLSQHSWVHHNTKIPSTSAPPATMLPAIPRAKELPSPVNGAGVPMVVPFVDVVPLVPV